MKTLTASILFGAMLAGPAFAQNAPALQNAAPEERARLEKLIEGAKQEGALSYLDTVLQPSTNDDLVAAFRKHYGLPSSFKVNYALTTTGNLVTRVEQEIGADRVTTDVVAIASPTWAFEQVAAHNVMEYASPEYKNYSKVFEQGFGQDGYFAFNGAYVFVPMWNAEKLDFKGKSIKDVIGAVAAGRISIGDVGKSTAYLATFVGQRDVADEKFFRDLAAMKPSFLIRSEQIAARLVTGEDLMAFSGMPTRAYQYNQKGAKLKFLLPEEGVVLLPQNLFILAKAPHPNSARLWLDFILSEQGQTILAKDEALISGRSGFKSPLPDYAPAIDDLKLIKVDWKATSSAKLKELRDAWVATFNP
jgi:iron(III) transport system substrate-binding protein